MKPGSVLLAFFATLVAGALGGGLLLVQRAVLDIAVRGNHLGSMPALLGMLVVVGVVVYLAQRVAAYRELKAVNTAQFLVYDAVHRSMQRIDGDSQSLPPGQLVARLNSDIQTMCRAVGSLPKLAGDVLSTVFTVVIMLLLHPLLGLITLLVVPLLFVVARRSRSKIQPATWEAQQREAEMAQLAYSAIAGVRVVKAMGQEQREIERMATASTALYDARMRLIRLQAFFQPFLESISGVAQVTVVFAGGWLVLRGELSIGTFLAFSVYNSQLVGIVRGFADTVVKVQEAGVCAGRVLELIDLPPAVVEAPDAYPLPDLCDQVVLDGVTFGYGDGEPVLRGIDLRIDAGETVALYGVAGSGKSTVVKLLARCHDPQRGAVRIDGIDLRDVTLDSVRRQVGVVFDEPMLFSGTIRDNIAYGRPDAADAEVFAAAETAGAHEFITGLPDGYSTMVGERGYTLSGGQRQRIALARTLLLRPRLLLLDDPTAGVDAELEREIYRRLRDSNAGQTTVFVGYRASTLSIADRIVMLDDGRVVDHGRHEDLLDRCALYRRLIQPEAETVEPPELPILPAARSVAPVPVRPEPATEPFSVPRLLRPYLSRYAGVLALLVVLTSIGVFSPYLTRDAVDSGIMAGSASGVLGAALAILAMYVVGLLLTPPTMTLAGRIGQRVVLVLRARVWTRLVRLPIDYYERHRGGRLLTRLTVDVDSFSQFASTGVVISAVSVLTVVGVLLAMLVVNPLLTALIAAAVLPFVGLLWLYNRRIAAAYLGAREQVAEANSALQENLAGVREAQAFGQQERQHEEYRRLIKRHLDYRLKAEKHAAASYPVVSFLGGLAVTLVLGVGSAMLARGTLTPGDLIACVLWSSIFFPPIVQLGTFFAGDVKRVGVSTGRIRELMVEDDGPSTVAEPVRLAEVRGEIRFSGVRFRYPGTRADVLHGIDLAVPAGNTVALVGPTGAGKSTLFKLLARFYDSDAGQLLVDGVDLRSIDLAEFRTWLGYLPQEPYLFAGTVRENIAYGRPHATDDEIEAAARAVGAHEAICGLPGGYRHVVGERGAALSGGLRQLVCLARVWLVDPAIVLLDEATAKLDLSTEARVLAAIRAVTRGRTTFMIAHRLQTAMLADHVVVLDDGRIVERGTHHELLAAGGRYASLFKASMSMAMAA
jgi:ATP-binding cassette subfamily B protein